MKITKTAASIVIAFSLAGCNLESTMDCLDQYGSEAKCLSFDSGIDVGGLPQRGIDVGGSPTVSGIDVGGVQNRGIDVGGIQKAGIDVGG